MEEKSNLLVPAAIIVAGAIVAAAVLYVGGWGGTGRTSTPSSDSSVETASGQDSIPAASAELADDDPFLGKPDAPVAVIEFGDFQCPFCGRFFKSTEPQIIEHYVKTGKVKFVYRDFAFLGPESELAAMAAECADEQGKFWLYHDYLYNNQQGENQGAFSKENLKRFAGILGLEAAKFDQCLDSDKYREEVRKDTADGRSAGMNGTPTTFINGRMVVGALPFSEFEQIIEQELAK